MLEVKGRSVDVVLKANGTILEIEKEVSVHELPKSVQKCVAARYPKAKIEKAEELTRRARSGPLRSRSYDRGRLQRQGQARRG